MTLPDAGLAPASNEVEPTATAPLETADHTTTIIPDQTGPGIEGEDEDYATAYHRSRAELLAMAKAPKVGTPVIDEPVKTEAAAPVETDSDDDDGGEALEIRNRQRVTAHDEANALAMTLYRKAQQSGSPIDFDVAFARAKGALGLESAPAATPDKAPDAPSIPATSEIDARLAQIKNDLRKAGLDDFDEERFDALLEEQAALVAQRADAVIAEKEQERSYKESIAATWSENASKIVEQFPAFGVEGSVAWKEMAAMQAIMEANGDPILGQSNAPLIVGQRVAAKLEAQGRTAELYKVPEPPAPALPPGKTAATSSRTPSASPSLPVRSGPQPYGGASGTASTATGLADAYANGNFDPDAYRANDLILRKKRW